MSSAVIQLIVLAGIAIFLILRLKSVLGTREGFEKPPLEGPSRRDARRDFEVIEGGVDTDIADHVKEGSDAASALADMKAVEPSFNVGEFLQGARGAYEMILMAYENGNMEEVRPYLAAEVYEAFEGAVAAREAEGLRIEASFVGLRDIGVADASFDKQSGEAEVTVKFTGELTSVVRNAEGEIVEGSPTEIKRQRDVWTFGRVMGTDDPNWQLVATGE
ncbi:Tim44/TimA family putative adaptor protein [Rhodovulum sp. YNF3179]|uniref:Tim44/TimA family putative adaptor protein n=1 Tax=Rhodovulum sp. YNF3179 TaxID=3425127 RepID=UPI003D34F4D4